MTAYICLLELGVCGCRDAVSNKREKDGIRPLACGDGDDDDEHGKGPCQKRDRRRETHALGAGWELISLFAKPVDGLHHVDSVNDCEVQQDGDEKQPGKGPKKGS